MVEELKELKGRLAELSAAMDELLSRQSQPAPEPPDKGGPDPPSAPPPPQ